MNNGGSGDGLAKDKLLSHQEAHTLLLKEGDGHVMSLAPLGFSYVSNPGDAVGKNIVPISIYDALEGANHERLPNALQVDWIMHNTMEWYAPFQRHIHAVRIDEKMPVAVKHLYFPKWGGRKTKDTGGVAGEEPVSSDGTQHQWTSDCFITYLQLRNIDSLPVDRILDIDDLFYTFTDVNTRVPFVKKLSKNTGSMVKIHKSLLSLADSNGGWLSRADLENWVKAEVFRRNAVMDALIIKVVLRRPPEGKVGAIPVLATLTILANGTCDLKLKMPVEMRLTLQDIQGFVDDINKLCSRISKTLIAFDKNIVIQDGMRTTSKIVRMTTAALFRSNGKIANVASIDNVATTKTYDRYFAVSPTAVEGGGISHLLYKRIDGYGSDDAIALYIARQVRLKVTPTDIKLRLQKMFSLSSKDADGLIKAWVDNLKTWRRGSTWQRGRGMLRGVQNVNLRIKPSASVYKVISDGLTSVSQMRRIYAILKLLLQDAVLKSSKGATKESSAKKTKKSNDNNNDPAGQMLDEDAVKDIVEEVDDQYLADSNDDVIGDFDNLDDILKAYEIDDGPNTSKDTDGNGDDNGDGMTGVDDDDPSLNDGVDLRDDINPVEWEASYRNYLINELNKADEKLFKFGSEGAQGTYAKSCQHSSGRQPVVIFEHEVGKQDPAAYTNIVNHGSTEELAAKNFYICPDVWCPISRIAMNRDTYEANGRRCPNPKVRELPLVFYNHSYWQDTGKKGEYKKRYLSFFTKSKHPAQLKMPCCYKKEPNGPAQAPKGANNKANVETKTPQQFQDEPSTGNEKYVKASTSAADVGRFSVLPPKLSAILGNDPKNCGAGLIVANKTNCFFRQGIALRRQTFLHAMSQILNNEGLKDDQDVVKAICDNMTVELFMSLENGWLCKKFMSSVDPLSIYDPVTYNKFRAWVVRRVARSQGVLVDRLHAKSVVKYLQAKPVFDKHSATSKLVLRDFVVYTAFTRFLEYVANDEIVKSHEFLSHLFNIQLPWLNNKGYNVLVIESDYAGNIYLPCLQYELREHRPVILLLKTDTYYEPISHVKLAPEMQTKIKFDLGDREYKYNIRKLIGHLRKKCVSEWILANDEGADILDALVQNNFGVKCLVIDYDLHVVGCVLRKPKQVFVPLTKPCNIYSMLDQVGDEGVYVVFGSEVTSHVETVDPSEYKKVLAGLNASGVYGAAAAVSIDNVSKDDSFVVLKSASGLAAYVIVLKAGGATENTSNLVYSSDMNMVMRWEDADGRKALIDGTSVVDGIYVSMWNEVIKYASRNRRVMHNLVALRHYSNPLPAAVRRRLVESLIGEKLMQKLRVGREPTGGLDPNGFHNRLCSDIGNKLDCIGQCTWLVHKENGGGFCRLRGIDKHHDILMMRLVNELLNPFVPLRQRVVNPRLAMTSDIILLTDAEVKSNKISSIMRSLSGDAWGFKRQDATFDLQSFMHEMSTNAAVVVDEGSEPLMHISKEGLSALPELSAGLFKGFKTHPIGRGDGRGVYGPMSLYAFMSRIYDKIHAEKRGRRRGALMTGEKLRSIVVARIIDMYAEDAITVYKRLAYNSHIVSKKLLSVPGKADLGNRDAWEKKTEKHDSSYLKEMLEKNTYYPSDFEVEVLAQLLGINIITIGRKCTRNRGEREWCHIGKRNGDESATQQSTLILRQVHETNDDNDRYEVVVKDGKITFEGDDFETGMRDFVSKLCRKYIFLDDK